MIRRRTRPDFRFPDEMLRQFEPGPVAAGCRSLPLCLPGPEPRAETSPVQRRQLLQRRELLFSCFPLAYYHEPWVGSVVLQGCITYRKRGRDSITGSESASPTGFNVLARPTPGRGRLRTAHPLDIQGWMLELAPADIYLGMVRRIEALDTATHNR